MNCGKIETPHHISHKCIGPKPTRRQHQTAGLAVLPFLNKSLNKLYDLVEHCTMYIVQRWKWQELNREDVRGIHGGDGSKEDMKRFGLSREDGQSQKKTDLSNLTKSASRGAHSPVRGHPRGRKLYH